MRQVSFFLFFITIISQTNLSAQTAQERVQQQQAEKIRTEQENSLAPDYSNLYFWAAHPAKKDMSDSVPSFLRKERRDTLADVFFLHPTTFTQYSADLPWNALLDDTVLNNATDKRTILFQSSVFNNCCRIFAPRYRQAHLKVYLLPNSEPSQKAFDFAYNDLKTAFQYYLDHYNKGRPIIIASHSQGAMHAIRLLQEFFDGKPLQKQLVCAYIVGWQIKPDDFKYIPVGTTPDATGCFVGWRSFKKGEIDFFIKNEKGGSVCVNPISWTTSTDETSAGQHKGAIWKNMNKLIPGVIAASIEPEHKVLWVDAPEKEQEKIGGKVKNYHIADYNLFWLDIRENAMLRVKAFLKK
ncbi:MAG TPA: DUF3089 domain-containing protein [Chitinophagaceae bacterium]|nr:DUF3089 domain-containing protein [Chitinophagaceae bacterium]